MFNRPPFIMYRKTLLLVWCFVISAACSRAHAIIHVQGFEQTPNSCTWLQTLRIHYVCTLFQLFPDKVPGKTFSWNQQEGQLLQKFLKLCYLTGHAFMEVKG